MARLGRAFPAPVILRQQFREQGVTFVATVGAGTGVNTVGVPSGALAGDLAVFVAFEDGPSISWTGGVGGTPSVSGLPSSGLHDGTLASMLVGYKFVTDNTDTAVVNQLVVRMRCYLFRGATALVQGGFTNGTDSSAELPSKTISTPDSFVLATVVADGSAGNPPSGPPASMTAMHQTGGAITANGYYAGPLASWAGDVLTWGTGDREWAAFTGVIE